MTRRLSLASVVVISLVLCWTRVQYSELCGWSPMKVTQWDAFGYYQYLPAALIHHDVGKLAWVERIDSTYHVLGTTGPYQFIPLENGNRVDRYFGGCALMQAPFFVIGHWMAGSLHEAQDGFSSPYQWAIAWSPIVYCVLALFVLRIALLRFFKDVTVALTLLLIVLATNAIQYISVDNAQTHGYLFALYALVLWATIRWHEAPRARWALLIGATIGLATAARPTEVLMLFLPLMWNTGTQAHARAKWAAVRAHRTHIGWALAGALVMVLPQLIYWKMVTGSWVYDVGSKWEFLDPHWRVLFGWEKGWFIYTPITLLFIAGLFLLRHRPWGRSVITFALLNIWIVIAWHDWRYGGSYSTRALVQSYPVLALAFAVVVERMLATRWRWAFLTVCGYLLVVNLWQIRQYNNGVIKYDGMTREEYLRVYLQ